jgi:hypothetical protein
MKFETEIIRLPDFAERLDQWRKDGWRMIYAAPLFSNLSENGNLFCVFEQKESALRLVRFVNGSDIVWIDPADVEVVENAAGGKSRVHVKNGKSFTVEGAPDVVAEQLAEDIG